jgi:hypothetical protein
MLEVFGVWQNVFADIPNPGLMRLLSYAAGGSSNWKMSSMRINPDLATSAGMILGARHVQT